jgi:hypothetical protein
MRERRQQAAREAEDPQAAERLRREGEADLANPNISEEEKRLILLNATIFAIGVATLFANDPEARL